MRESITQIRRVIVARRSRYTTVTTEKKPRKEDKQKGAGEPAPVHKTYSSKKWIQYNETAIAIIITFVFLFDVVIDVVNAFKVQDKRTLVLLIVVFQLFVLILDSGPPIGILFESIQFTFSAF
jgi:hypothetical protein